MPSDVLGNSEREIARCQSERPDIYDVHYDAIEQLKAVHARAIPATARPARSLASRSNPRNARLV